MAFGRIVEVQVDDGKETTIIEELKIEFSTTKTDDPESNTGTVTIYNTNESTTKKLCTAGNKVVLKAGYEDEIISPVIFGDIIKGSGKRDGVDYVVELEVADSRTTVMENIVSVSYTEDISASTVLKGFTDTLGLPVKGAEKIPSDEKYSHGFAFIGMAVDGIREVLNRFELTYTIQNEMLYIRKPNESIDDSGLSLDKTCGLLTTPYLVSDATNSEDVGTEIKAEWTFNTLLFPQLMPGTVCSIDSDTLRGQVIIKEAVFTGDNRDGDFIVEIKAVES